MPSPFSLKQTCTRSFLGAPVLLLIAPWGNSYYWCLWIVIFALNSAWNLFLAYRNESYTAYILTALGYLIFIPTHLSMLMLYIWHKESPTPPEHYEYLILSSPYIISAALVAWFAMQRTTSSPFYCEDGKAHIFDYADPPSTRNQILSVLAFIAGATVIESIGGATAWLLMSGVMLACAVYIIYQGRHLIAGLRDLIKEERSASMRYTFFQIGEIREARRRWWISRLARWVKNCLSSRPSS